MLSADQLSARLSAKSRQSFYDVYRRFEWVESLDPDRLAMTPEVLTLYGTELWDELTDEQKHRLSVCETGNLFANTLHGEQVLVAGLSRQLYGKKLSDEVTDYLHHFLDEENKHMVMFGLFCRKYVGRVYPERTLSFPKEYGPGEEVIGFYAMAMVVEAFGDHYNLRTMNDDRCDPLAREISMVHHADESRHLGFDRAYLTELTSEWLPRWDEAQREKFRGWLAGFMKANWATYYNPRVYEDIGLNGWETRRIALNHPYQVELREKIQRPVAGFFQRLGLLDAAPPV